LRAHPYVVIVIDLEVILEASLLGGWLEDIRMVRMEEERLDTDHPDLLEEWSLLGEVLQTTVTPPTMLSLQLYRQRDSKLGHYLDLGPGVREGVGGPSLGLRWVGLHPGLVREQVLVPRSAR